MAVTVFAPGRVNLIGDHTDYTGGLCLPMAVHLGITIRGEPGGDVVRLRSDEDPDEAIVPLDVADPRSVEPAWARYVAGVVAEIRPRTGFTGTVSSTLPTGAGLSSSAALEIATALVLGFEGSTMALAQATQRAEQAASGVPCGILDQLSSAGGVAGSALVMDCRSLSLTPISLPREVEVRVVHSGQERTLVGSAYAERRAQCEAAEGLIGSLRDATLAQVATIDDETLRRRARHVVTENERVRRCAAAFAAGDIAAAGRLFDESHASLRDDFETSTPTVDAVVDRLRALPGVHGVRITGGGFGGCVVALTAPGALAEGWLVEPGPGAERR